MYCVKCGNQMDDMLFCQKCGTPSNPQKSDNQQPEYISPPKETLSNQSPVWDFENQPDKPKKSIYKQVWFWVIVGFALIYSVPTAKSFPDFLGSIGAIGFMGSIILLIVWAVRKKPKKNALICMGVSFAILCFAGAISPKKESVEASTGQSSIMESQSSSKLESSSKVESKSEISKSADSSGQEETTPQPVNVMDVDYIDMWENYTDTKYKDKWVKITGEVSSVNPNGIDITNGIKGYVNIKSDEKVEEDTYSKGDTVTVIGQVDGKSGSFLTLKYPIMQKANAAEIAMMSEYAAKREEQAEIKREQFIESAESPSYDDLSRYPDKYKTIPIKITVYVKDVNVDKMFGLLEGGYMCTINGQELVIYDNREVKEPKLLKGDTVTIYGYGNGQATMQRKQKGLILDKVVDEWYIPSVKIEYVSAK